MYMYFAILGFLFVCGSSIVINFLDDIFPNNKIAYFLNPSLNTVWNNISVVVLPIIIWGFISLPILGSNLFFTIGVLLNIFISCSIIYVVKYGTSIIFGIKNKIIDVISIIFANFWGFCVVYISLLLNESSNDYILFSIISMIVLLLIYYFIKKFPPKSDFFIKEY